MKIYIGIFIFILSLLSLKGQGLLSLAGPTPIASSGPFFTETFENATNYDNAPFSTSGTINANYATSPAPLAGAESLLLISSSNITWDLGSTYTELWGKFTIKQPNDYGGNHGLRLYNATNATANDNVLAYIDFNTNANITTNQGFTAGLFPVGTSDTTNLTPESTTYYIFWHYKISDGSNNGVFEVWLETSDSRSGGADNITSDGRRTDGCKYIYFSSPGTDTIIDGIEVSINPL